MKILFFPVDCCPFHAKTIEERPLGGTETGIIRLAEALQDLGNEVFVCSSAPFPLSSEVKYIAPQQVRFIQNLDIYIVVRGWSPLFLPIEAKQRYFWTGDAWFSKRHLGIGDKRIVKETTAMLAVSVWHAKTLCEVSGFPNDKCLILRNGVHLADFAGTEKRHRRRLIYSSTPFRGLSYLAPVFRKLKRKYADLEMKIFSSMSIYNKEWIGIPEKDGFEKVYEELSQLPDVTVSGSILQKDLAREFMQASILAYPCNYEETSCITAMEAQAAGCVIVTSDLAALSETVGEAGILLKSEPGSSEYMTQFTKALDSLLSDDVLFDRYSSNAKKQSLSTDWKNRAEDFLRYASQNQKG